MKLLWTRCARLIAAGLVAVTSAGALSVVPQSSAAESTGDANVTWGACPPPAPGRVRDPRQQCATVKVPLNYQVPWGRKIDVTISRIVASTPEKRRGILMFNPGGPGGVGLDMPSVMARRLPPEVQSQYDLIGFDPRGTGTSTPVTCAIPADTPFELFDPYPAPDGSIDENIDFARKMTADCFKHSGDLLPFITTPNAARDMDRIRAALGERKLSFFGWSAGTYLGAVYSSLFPGRRDRMVFDTVADPALVWRDARLTWGKAIEDRFADLAKNVAGRNAELGLGATPEEVKARYFALAAELDSKPIKLLNDMTYTGNLMRWASWLLLFSEFYLPRAGGMWKQAGDILAGTGTPETLKALTDTVAFLGVLGLYPPMSPGVPTDNGVAAHYAYLCGDAAWPRRISEYVKDVAEDARAWPITAGMPANVVACAWWTPPIERPVEVKDTGDRSILILQNRRDPAASWEAALGMRRTLQNTAAFVGVDAGGNGSYGLGSCADSTAHTFLATGKLPAEDVFCGPPPSQAAEPLVLGR